jgi:hypothetical protein
MKVAVGAMVFAVLLALSACLLALSAIPAHAYTCEQVRWYVATHSKQDIEDAKKQMTREQVREALRCLR